MDTTATERAVAAELVGSLHRVAGGGPPQELGDRLCREVVRVLGLRGACLVALFDAGMVVPVGVSGPGAACAEERAFTRGEGPSWEALRTGAVVAADQDDGRAVLVVPVRLASGLRVALCCTVDTVGAVDAVGALDPVALAAGLRRVLEEASPPPERGGAAWLDAPSALRRGAVWLAEEQLAQHHRGPLDRPGGHVGRRDALEAMRAHCRRLGGTVDDLAAALLRGTTGAEEVLGAG